MTHVTLITVGNLKEDYLRAAAKEYETRLSGLVALDRVELTEERIRDEEDKTAVAAALRAEGERIIARIPDGAYTVALCVEGKQYDSRELADLIKERTAYSGRLCLIIGSSHGLSPEVKARADLRLSVSKMTFPHQLMRVMLLEILYRTYSIIAGKKYHK